MCVLFVTMIVNKTPELLSQIQQFVVNPNISPLTDEQMMAIWGRMKDPLDNLDYLEYPVQSDDNSLIA